jgi:hypothetical protein
VKLAILDEVHRLDNPSELHRGWQELRSEDMGLLWEHFVLNEIMTRLQSRDIGYWRDKRGHEVDFVLAGRREHPLAIECKWSLGRSDNFDPVGFEAFRKQHPEGDNVVIAKDIDRTFTRNYGPLKVRFENLGQFANLLV